MAGQTPGVTAPYRDWADPPARLMTVPSVPASVARIRHFAADACRDAGAGAACDTVALLVSEIATNALVHGSGEVRVSVWASPGVVRVEVDDDGAGLPVRRQADPDAEGGRGLALVEALSTGWGVQPGETGKTVWFELDAAP